MYIKIGEVQHLSFDNVLALFITFKYLERWAVGLHSCSCPGPPLEERETVESMCRDEDAQGASQVLLLPGVTVLCCLLSEINCFI